MKFSLAASDEYITVEKQCQFKGNLTVAVEDCCPVQVVIKIHEQESPSGCIDSQLLQQKPMG